MINAYAKRRSREGLSLLDGTTLIYLRSVNGLSGMPFANANIARAVANAAINYNNAYSAYVVAKATSRALCLGFSAAYFVAENYMSDWLGQFF